MSERIKACKDEFVDPEMVFSHDWGLADLADINTRDCEELLRCTEELKEADLAQGELDAQLDINTRDCEDERQWYVGGDDDGEDEGGADDGGEDVGAYVRDDDGEAEGDADSRWGSFDRGWGSFTPECDGGRGSSAPECDRPDQADEMIAPAYDTFEDDDGDDNDRAQKPFEDDDGQNEITSPAYDPFDYDEGDDNDRVEDMGTGFDYEGFAIRSDMSASSAQDRPIGMRPPPQDLVRSTPKSSA